MILGKRVRKVVSVCVLGAAVVALVLNVGPGPALGQVGSNPECTPQEIEHALEMNSIVVGRIVKTVKVEKEIFLCDLDSPFSGPDHVVDLQIFTEILERVGDRPPFKTPVKTVEAIRCLKPLSNPNPQCQQIQVPRLTSKPGGQVRETPVTPKDPIEMNTVKVRKVIKTIKAQKEVFDIAGSDGRGRILEVETFTEIFEKINPDKIRNEKGFPVKRYEVIDCVKDYPQGSDAASEPQLPELDGCFFSETFPLSG